MNQLSYTTGGQIESKVGWSPAASSVPLIPPMNDVRALFQRQHQKADRDRFKTSRPTVSSEDEPMMLTTTTQAFRSCLSQSLDRLRDIECLQPNWNSYGSNSISTMALQFAKDLLRLVQERFFSRYGERIIPSEIVPLDDGGIQVSWQCPGSEIEVEIGPDKGLRLLVVEGSGEARTFAEEDDVAIQYIIDNIERVMAS